MNGSSNITLPAITVVPPTEAQSYLLAARELYSGAEELSNGSGKTAIACAFLAAQAAECALKAYLSQAGIPSKELKKNLDVRHNLDALWEKAVSCGLSVQAQPPQWCLTLNLSHDKPYYFRYPVGLNGFSLPALSPMISGLKSLIDTIEKIV